MRAHKFIYKCFLASNMRPINVTLDSVTWELAKQKPNFSAWVRDQLRSERNKSEKKSQWCRACRGRPVKIGNAYCKDCQIDMGIIMGEEE
jgi:hypothetical protein